MSGIHDYLGRVVAGRFLLESVLGTGGMGVVFLALDQDSNRRVALKLASAARSQTQINRFVREGEVSASLDHPGIVRIYSAGVMGNQPYLVYELIEGARELDEVFPELDLVRRVELVAEVAEALGYAHHRGVVHRDVKPANVLVDRTGRTRLADFGIAKVEGADRLTATGALIGTPHYMSPEAFRGQPTTPASDVWSAGVLLYEALTGELPFPGSSIQELAPQIALAKPTPPSRIAENVPRGLQEVCLRSLRAKPEDRYPDGAALAEDLGRALRREDLSADLRRRSGPLILSALTLLGLTLAGAYAYSWTPSAHPQPSQTVRPTPTPTSLPDPGARWLLTRGDRFRGVLRLKDAWTPSGALAQHALTREASLDLDFEVRSLRGKSATLEATIRDLFLAAGTTRLDSKEGAVTLVPITQVKGQRLTLLLDPRTGSVKRVVGAKAIRASIVGSASGPFREMIRRVMLPLDDGIIRRAFAQAFHQFPNQEVRPAKWTLERELMLHPYFSFSYEAQASETAGTTTWLKEGWKPIKLPSGDRMESLTIHGSSAFRQGRVSRSTTEFALRIRRKGVWNEVEGEIGYEELPLEEPR